MSESEIALKFADATIGNFNLILSNNNIDIKFDLETLSKKYDKFIEVIGVINDKKSVNYEKTKKSFGKFLNYNYKLIKSHLEVDESIIDLFKDSPNRNWYLLHVSIVSYLSYLKQLDTNSELNYKGMIDKLMIEIEEYTDSDNDADVETDADTDANANIDVDADADAETNANNIKNLADKFNTKSMLDEISKQIPQTEATPKVMKGLIGDIKDILSSNNLKNTSIVDISRSLSDKYQNSIDKGDVNISDLLSGVFGILNDPESLNGEFDDIDPDNLPDPNTILSDMANDPKLKEAMNMMGGNNMNGMNGMNNMFSSMMSSMMSNNNNNSVDNKSISELEKEIERMMREVQAAEATKDMPAADRLLDLEIPKVD